MSTGDDVFSKIFVHTAFSGMPVLLLFHVAPASFDTAMPLQSDQILHRCQTFFLLEDHAHLPMPTILFLSPSDRILPGNRCSTNHAEYLLQNETSFCHR